ncbi:MAG: protein translocase subunit SecD, partial [Gemmatimonadaceae bacterium]
MANLKYRFALIVALLIVSVWSLFPRTVVERIKVNGVFKDTSVSRVPLKKGLDLQGGMHLALEIDDSKQAVANKSDALDRAIKVVRQRIDEFGVSEPVVQKQGTDRIIVELPGVDDPARATALIQQAAFLEFQTTDKTGALDKVVARLDEAAKTAGIAVAGAKIAGGDTAQSKTVSSLLTQADTNKKKGGADSLKKGADSTTAATVAGGLFSSNIQAGQIPGMYIVPDAAYTAMDSAMRTPAVQAAMPPGKVMRWGVDSLATGAIKYRALYVLDARPLITGVDLIDAKPSSDPMSGNVVVFTLNNEGGRRFKSETGKHVRDNMAIVLDKRVITAPTINEAIGVHGQITLGGGTLQAAQDLALVLRAGALPVPLKVAETRNIGASLGADSIHKGILSLGIALALVVIIMITYYRFAGVLAVLALALYLVYTLATLAGFHAVLTLPGLAGFVLSIGIAVDANVLIFERIREELVH